ncbi:tetratricopeptide repeat protein [candidate division KSB3 bacterium]|uniref:Tetratricopeptide repeat protein n=1 Tax=candidate division KSB3 bacterium TaxID=2044937 RepID=A0A9D5Q4I6_9BACT|nr:tetratricopeptide repeat protein [candidate division KSB3 bacterium]MBD3323308.1 tetratricopeptide repeat protein [candidate division KSB3 bacterium]
MRDQRRHYGQMVLLIVWIAMMSGCVPPRQTPGHRPQQPSPEIDQQQRREARERSTAEWAYKQGLLYLDQGNLAEAIRHFQLAIERDATHLRAYLSLGDVYSMQGEYLVAESYYNNVLKYDPRSIPAYTALGAMYQKMGNYREALSFYQKILEIDPGNQLAQDEIANITEELFHAHYEQGMAYQAAGQLDQALIEFQKAHSLYSGDIEFTVEIGNLFLQQGDYMMADGYFQQALSQDPLYVPALLGAGKVQLALDHYTQAQEYFQQSAELQPGNPEAAQFLEETQSEQISTALPPQYTQIPNAAQATRGDLAALLIVELRLENRLQSASRLAIISDITTHWAKPYIIKAVQLGAMQMFPDRSFLPDEPVRKGELAFILDNLFRQLDMPLPAAGAVSFTDVHPDNMYHDAVLRVYAAGLMNANTDTTFGFNESLSGQEVLNIINRVKSMIG